jgi:hypothetical protein
MSSNGVALWTVSPDQVISGLPLATQVRVMDEDLPVLHGDRVAGDDLALCGDAC